MNLDLPSGALLDADLKALFWAAATMLIYLGVRRIHQRVGSFWTQPLLLTWALCFALVLLLHASYGDYIRGTHWLITLLGPATVAFAMPIYEQRTLIRRYWPVLLVGVIAGSAIAFASSWMLADALHLSADIRLSLLPRSVTTPFALAFAEDVGGQPEVTATCVVITGLLGASLGELLLKWLPLRSAMARGALFGMGAHAVGTAKARQVGDIEGTIASLTMVLAGLASVLAAPLLAYCLRS